MFNKGVDFLEKRTEGQTAMPTTHSIRKGPMEGVLIVDGRPQMERMDMPSISFESILALQRINQKRENQ